MISISYKSSNVNIDFFYFKKLRKIKTKSFVPIFKPMDKVSNEISMGLRGKKSIERSYSKLFIFKIKPLCIGLKLVATWMLDKRPFIINVLFTVLSTLSNAQNMHSLLLQTYNVIVQKIPTRSYIWLTISQLNNNSCVSSTNLHASHTSSKDTFLFHLLLSNLCLQ